MTEHQKVSSEEQFVDKTISKSGSGMTGSGIPYDWMLQALPEYIESDEELAKKCVGEYSLIIDGMGLIDATIKIEEGYSNEPEGGGHFRLRIIYGQGSENLGVGYSKKYSAETHEGTIEGVVRARAGLATDDEEKHKEVVETVAEIYIGNMEDTYPEYENSWEEGVFENIN